MRLVMYWVAASIVLVTTVVILRIIVRRDYLQNGSLTPFSSAMEWLLGIIWAAFSYFYLPDDWPKIHVNLVLQLAGWVFIFIGVLLMIVSLAWLGLRRTHGLETDILIQLGPYRFSRNPQILGFGLGMIGFVLLWPSWHMVVSIFLLIVLIHLMVLTEEEHLLCLFGDDYREYGVRVPRYISMPRKNTEDAG